MWMCAFEFTKSLNTVITNTFHFINESGAYILFSEKKDIRKCIK